ncbi:MAG TPA: single-stranded DNA-binding protein [Candidatus Binataceae bacterium]
MSRNRIELVGVAVSAPEVRITPAGTPVLRVEVNCGEGREVLRLGVVMAGEDARELGARIAAGATLKVTGTLRAVRGNNRWSSAGSGVEVLASAISEVAADAVA